MFQIGRYNLRTFHLSNLPTKRLWLSALNHNFSTKSQSESVPIQGVIKQPVNSSIFQPYDVIVVGGGHAGCEGK